MKATTVEALPGYRLMVSFDDNVAGIIKLESFIQNGIFAELKNEALFSQVKINGSSISWNDDLEIDANAIYAELKGVDPEKILHTSFSNAAN